MTQSMNNSVQGGNLNVANTVGAAERDRVRLDVRDDAEVSGEVSRDAGLGGDVGGSGGAEADISRESATDSDGGDRGGVDRLGDDSGGGVFDLGLRSVVDELIEQVDIMADVEPGGVVEIDDVDRVDLALVVGVGQECAAMRVLLLAEVDLGTDGSEAVVEVLAVVMVEALGLALVGRVAVLVVGRPDLDSALDALVHGVGDISGDDRGRVVVVVEPLLLDGGVTNPADRVVHVIFIDFVASVLVVAEHLDDQTVVLAGHVGEGDESTILGGNGRVLAEHDSGLESVEAIIVGVAHVVLDLLAVAEVGVEAVLGDGTADVDAVMFVFVMGAVDGGVDSGQVLGWNSGQLTELRVGKSKAFCWAAA
ncbi:hypothetical protein D6C78_00950 [Aureobasidium pullulans]|uniref:Uncharacterized protein n=1 Tax=Aureobasidium pullulans TaxID=5580 RepID=A0A4T0C580_AURPU|nr:hypothetical protein D6C78_00950 [Aureobasidium pullulans]